MRTFSNKLVTLFSNMAQGVGETQVSLKRHLEALSKQIYDIDIQIQTFKQQGNLMCISNLEAAKTELQKLILQAQIKLEHKRARARTGGDRLVSGESRV